MLIMIPSRGRSGVLAVSTLSHLPDTRLANTVLWVHSSEYDEYKTALNQQPRFNSVSLIHSEYSTIGEKRRQMGQYAFDQCYAEFCMMDDDLDFLIRKKDDNFALRTQMPEETVGMLDTIQMYLRRGYAQVCISPREGNNRFGDGGPDELVNECTRGMRITAYRTKDFLSVEHDRVPVMEDFDVLLQLLRSGRKNIVLGYWANGQKKTNSAGGCSIWRTLELHNAAVEKMAELHPDFVKVRLKKNKTDADGFGTRKEVTVQWKRAYQSSQR